MSIESNPESPSFIGRIFANEAAKRGVAGAVAGILIATVLELWTSKD
jgi:hypothetical protein